MHLESGEGPESTEARGEMCFDCDISPIGS